jgi:hypothetical protein
LIEQFLLVLGVVASMLASLSLCAFEIGRLHHHGTPTCLPKINLLATSLKDCRLYSPSAPHRLPLAEDAFVDPRAAERRAW